MRKDRAAFLVVACVLVAGCSDSTAPVLTLRLSHASRHDSTRDDSIAVRADSVMVQLSGPGADTARWVVSHGGADWLELATTEGTGSGVIRWTRDPAVVWEGVWVDTIRVEVEGASGSPATVLDSFTIRPTQAEYVTHRRAWLPGERDARINAVVSNRAFVYLYVGDVSDLAPQIYADPDSVVEVIRNPLYPGAAAGPAGVSAFVLAPQFSAGWDVFGIEIIIVDANTVPRDTLHWVGVFWSNPAEQTWKGLVIAATNTNTVPATSVRTNTFDAGGAKSGAGGGEARQSLGQYWEANGTGSPPNNQITITASAFGAPQTVTSGPFTGGTAAFGFMSGRMRNIFMVGVLPSGSPPAAINVDLDFLGTSGSNPPLGAIKLTCVFPTPCTTAALAQLVAERRALRAGAHVWSQHRPRD